MYILKSLTLLNSVIVFTLLTTGLASLRGLIWRVITAQSTLIRFNLVGRGPSAVEVILLLDTLSLAFMFSVSVIAAAVISFAKSYIRGEVFFARFSLLVIRFVASMFLLILSPNLIRVLLGWDGLGVTSYLLVIYYYSTKSYNAGIITALTNRVGDVAILILIALILSQGRWNFIVAALEEPAGPYIISAAGVTLAAITKRAQIPFSAWLPAAMAAPTPVSALVHSSTLVTAGVYLLIRFNLALARSYYCWLILFFGSITILMAGIRAMFEMDMKKIVALSTLSQLGLMIRALGIGRPDIAFYHLLTHAYFKALLFICAGNLIHCRNDYQDLRQIGRMATNLPVRTSFVTLRNISLCGFPFLAGFYSKDIFLEVSLLSPLAASSVGIFFVATLLTAAYSLRFTVLTAIRAPHASALLWSRDEDRVITRGIWVLLPLAVIGGSLMGWVLFPTPPLIVLPLVLKLGAIIVTVGGVLLTLRIRFGEIAIQAHFVRWVRGTMWILPLISSRSWLISGLPASWNLRALVDNSYILKAYHQGPQEVSTYSAAQLEGVALKNFLRVLQTSAIWALVLLTLFLILYLRT